jgi:hypothetical protein
MRELGKKDTTRIVWLLCLLFLVTPFRLYAAAIIIDHTCIDLSQIPDTWIGQAKTKKLHYAHTSHGEQLTIGLERIEADNVTYSVAIESCNLPTESGALCIFDGQTSESYITPDLYWDSIEGRADTHSVLTNNPTITLSMWSWCTQQDGNTEEDTERYLDSMAMLEAANPGVTFIYMTGNAQATGSDGYNRHLRNEQIRDYCETNGKVLFDFADLDSWYNGAQATYQYEGHTVPVEHSHFHGDEAGHTTYESCEQKGKAVWWMMARLAGWNPGGSTTTTAGLTTTSTASSTTTTVGGPCPVEQVYGEYSPEAALLRFLRDNVLNTTKEGQEIVKLYYEVSPVIVAMFKDNEEFQGELREFIDGFLPLRGIDRE